MVKRIFGIILKILIVVLVYLLQIYVINKITFFGVTGNLCLMAVILITLMNNSKMAYVAAVLCGIVSDVLFSPIPCKYLVIYVIVVSVLIGLKKMYKQDSKISIIIFSASGIVISEILMYIFNIFQKGEIVNIFMFLLVILKECIINICLTFVLYLAFKLCRQEG